MRSLFALMLAAFVALAGCFHDSGGGGGGGGDGGDTPTLTSVAFTKAPTTGFAGTKPVACWKVEGKGKIPHTAIHWDTQSRATATSIAAYQGGAFYPDNATSQVEVTLPGTFCTGISLPSTPPAGGKVYLRAHAQIATPGVLSADERVVTVTEAGSDVVTAVTLLSTASKTPALTGAASPVKVASNETLVVCWKLEGKGNVTHTAIHWDSTSHASSDVTFQAYPKAAYPDNKSAGADATFAIGKSYCTGIKAPEKGKIFLRAHAIDVRGAPGVLTPEYQLDIVGKATSIAWVVPPPGSTPTTATPGQDFLVCWRVEGVGVVPHTAVHNDTTTHATDTGITAYPGADYPNNETAQNPAGYTVPAKFCTTVKVPATAGPLTNVYIRAHVAGITGDLVTDEKSVLVVV